MNQEEWKALHRTRILANARLQWSRTYNADASTIEARQKEYDAAVLADPIIPKERKKKEIHIVGRDDIEGRRLYSKKFGNIHRERENAAQCWKQAIAKGQPPDEIALKLERYKSEIEKDPYTQTNPDRFDFAGWGVRLDNKEGGVAWEKSITEECRWEVMNKLTMTPEYRKVVENRINIAAIIGDYRRAQSMAYALKENPDNVEKPEILVRLEALIHNTDWEKED